MTLKLLKIFPSGRREVKEIQITNFYWDNHKFYYVPIKDGYASCCYLSLEQDEDIMELKI